MRIRAAVLHESAKPRPYAESRPLVVEELTRLITRLRDEGVSLLLVEQNLNLAEAVADVVYVMVKGQMVYHAPLERFRAEREEVKASYLTL